MAMGTLPRKETMGYREGLRPWETNSNACCSTGKMKRRVIWRRDESLVIHAMMLLADGGRRSQKSCEHPLRRPGRHHYHRHLPLSPPPLQTLMHGSSRESGGHTRGALPSMRPHSLPSSFPSNGNLCSLTPSIHPKIPTPLSS